MHPMELQVLQNIKSLFTVILLTGYSLTCTGQTLFFGDLQSSMWTSDTSLHDSTIWKATSFSLQKLDVSKDSIKSDLTIWTFRDSLTVTLYNATTKSEEVIGTYEYEIRNSTLLLFFRKNTPLECIVGIVSGGSFVLLTEKKIKKMRRNASPLSKGRF